eukprot:5864039-Prymnesium_polylepis.1
MWWRAPERCCAKTASQAHIHLGLATARPRAAESAALCYCGGGGMMVGHAYMAELIGYSGMAHGVKCKGVVGAAL